MARDLLVRSFGQPQALAQKLVQLDADLKHRTEEKDLAIDDQVPGQDESPALLYPDLPSFVSEYLAPIYARSLEGRRRVWCGQSWAHSDAIARLDALWQAWEYLRLDPTLGLSTWWLHYADPHMRELFDPDGPFKGCGRDRGHQPRVQPLPARPPPLARSLE